VIIPALRKYRLASAPIQIAMLLASVISIVSMISAAGVANAQTPAEPRVELASLARQEQLLQFDSFNNDTALALGMQVIELARAAHKKVAVNVTRDGLMLFYFGLDGITADHANWIRRKSNLVNRTGHSSFYTHNEIKNNGGDVNAIPMLDQRDYAAQGGSFPLILKGTGPIGTITVTGLSGPEDHAMVVAALKACLKINADL
jgi:endoglucanase